MTELPVALYCPLCRKWLRFNLAEFQKSDGEALREHHQQCAYGELTHDQWVRVIAPTADQANDSLRAIARKTKLEFLVRSKAKLRCTYCSHRRGRPIEFARTHEAIEEHLNVAHIGMRWDRSTVDGRIAATTRDRDEDQQPSISGACPICQGRPLRGETFCYLHHAK